MTRRWVGFAVAALLAVPVGTGTQAPMPQPAIPTQRPDPPALDRLLTPGDIQVAQAHLHTLGFDPGPVDGIFTTQTQAAVRAFQARYGIPVSGLLDHATRLELLPGLDPKPAP